MATRSESSGEIRVFSANTKSKTPGGSNTDTKSRLTTNQKYFHKETNLGAKENRVLQIVSSKSQTLLNLGLLQETN